MYTDSFVLNWRARNLKDSIAIILAAGRGTRMKSDIPKVMHEIMGKPMIERVVEIVKNAGISNIIVVAGFGYDMVKSALSGVKVVLQKKLLGSGDAIMAAKDSALPWP